MNALTTHQASKNLDNLIEQIIEDIEPTILCTDQGKKAVLMPLDEFNSWQETLYLLSNPVNANHLFKSIHEAETGKVFEKELMEP